MRIPIEKLIICHPDLGDNNKSGLNPSRIGLNQVIGFDTLKNKSFIEVSEKVNCAMKKELNANPPLNTIKYYKSLGVAGIYNILPDDKEKIIIKKIKEGLYTVCGGNHRVIALILLGEKVIETGRGNCILDNNYC